MNRPAWLSRWLIIPLVLLGMISAMLAGLTQSSFFDTETSNASSVTAWTSANWTQTSQADFNAGVLSSVNITGSPGDVTLASSSAISTNSSTTSNGTWANPTNAYADGGSYGYITSGSPSANETYGGYDFPSGPDSIYGVRVRTDAWTVGTTNLTTSKNPAANTNGALPWTNPANGYTSDNSSATASPAYGAPNQNPTTTTNGTLPWTNPTNGYTSNNAYAAVSPTYGATTSKNPTATTNGTVPWTNAANAYSSNNAYATAVATIPTYRAAGTVASGTGAITPGLPAGMSANDVVILVASTITGGSMTISANGSITNWTAVPGSPIDVTGGEKLYVWWGRWSAGATGPTITPGSDHAIGRTIAFYNVYAVGSPIDVSATGTETTSDTSYSFATGLTTNYINELVITVVSTGRDATATNTFSGWADANLATITERMDNTTASGGGGGFGMAQGTLATPGAMGTWSGTLSAASAKAYIAFSLMATTPSNTFDQIYGTFGITDPGTSSTISKVEIGYEAFATATQRLNFYTSANSGGNWSANHTTANLATADPNAYTYIDVTSDQAWTWTLLNDTNFKLKMVTNWVNGTPTWSVDALIVRVTYDDRRVRDQIYGAFGFTDPGGSVTISKVEVGYEAFASATGALDIYTSNNSGSTWSANHTTANLATADPNGYTYIDVTSDYSWTWTILNDTNLKVKVATNWVSGTPAWSLDALVVRVTYDDTIAREQIYGTFGVTGTTETITKVEVGYEAFASATGALDIYTSNNGGSSWSTNHATANLGTSDPNSYTYIDVTSDFGGWTWTALNDSNLKLKVATSFVSGTPAWSLDSLVVKVTYNGLDNEQIMVRVTWDGGSNWSSYATNNTTGTEVSYWNDFTSATSWTWDKLSDANFKVSIEAVTAGDTGDVRLDWIPVEVNYQQYASSGTIASQVMDTTVTGSSWDGLFWDNTLATGTNVTFEVRASDTPFLSTNISPSWTSVGNVSTPNVIATNNPSANSGAAWTNPSNVYADDSSSANITSGAPSGSNSWGSYGFNLTGNTISQVRVRYDAWHGTLGQVQSWVSPTSDTANGWTNPALAYNGNTSDYASYSVPGSGTSPYLELYIGAINSDKVRVWSDRQGTRISVIDVDVYYNSQWNNIYSGSLTVGSYQEYSIGSTQSVSGMRIRYTSSGNPAQNAYAVEAQFNSIETASAPQIKIDVSWDGGGNWSATQTTALTTSETTYWYDVTSATTWDSAKLSDANFLVRALAQSVNGDVEVRVDWLPVEVTYQNSSTAYSIIITNGSGRYKQWRATLTPNGAQTITPILQEVRLYYYGP